MKEILRRMTKPEEDEDEDGGSAVGSRVKPDVPPVPAARFRRVKGKMVKPSDAENKAVRMGSLK